MRLFLAVALAPEVVRAAAEVTRELCERAHRLAPRARITWVSPERMHITLSFLGDVAPEHAEGLAARLRAPIGLPPFTITIAGLGVFPPKGPPRVIWAGIEAGRVELEDLAGRVAQRLAGAGVSAQDRGYHPHLTLARIREAAGLRTAALLDARWGARLGTTAVGAITLCESRLSPRGPAYVPLQHTPLVAE